ncbi:MAG: DUF58 domain-containing protein [Spirochaetales bacterium]
MPTFSSPPLPSFPPREPLPSSSESVFSFPLSLFLVGILSFASLVTNAPLLAATSGGILVMMLGTRLWARVAGLKLDYHVSLNREKLFPEETLTLCTVFENRKPLPVLVGLQSNYVSTSETLLGPFERTKKLYSLQVGKRGVYYLENLRLTLGDPLGLQRKIKPLPFKKEILVFPRLRKYEFSDSAFQEFFGIHLAKGLIQDPAWYAGTREYTGNRPARYIHWKASARLGTFQEKVFEPTSQEKIVFVLKTGGFDTLLLKETSPTPSSSPSDQTTCSSYPSSTLIPPLSTNSYQPSSAEAPLSNLLQWESTVRRNPFFEQIVEVIAYLGSLLGEAGADFAFLSDARMVGKGFPLVAWGKGYNQVSRLLETLARIEPVQNPDFKGIDTIARELSRFGTGYIFGCADPSRAEEAYRVIPPNRRHRLLVLTPMELGEEKKL